MQTITITPQMDKGRYYIDVPAEFAADDFTIQIILKKEKQKPGIVQERLEKVRAFAGLAAGSDIEIDKNEWYHQ